MSGDASRNQSVLLLSKRTAPLEVRMESEVETIPSGMITSENSLAGEHNNLILNPNTELRIHQMLWSYH